MHKLSRQQAQEENTELGKQLDSNFEDIFGELTFKPKKKLKVATDTPTTEGKTTDEIEEDAEYLAITRSMMFEPTMGAKKYINPEKAAERLKLKKRKKVTFNP